MFKQLNKPKDHYSADWAAYWAQNPGLHRGVGAEAVDPPADPPADPTPIDPAQFAALQESVAKLEAKNKELLQARADAKKAADKASDDARKATEDAARKSGDVEALEKSWREKLESETKDRDAKLTAYEQMINKMTVGAEAQRMASDLAVPGSADVLLPHIERRLTVEVKDGIPVVRVIDKDGKPSALSIDDLKKEIEGNPAFAPLIIGSKANGSGGVGGKGGAGNEDVMKLPPVERMNVGRSAKT